MGAAAETNNYTSGFHMELPMNATVLTATRITNVTGGAAGRVLFPADTLGVTVFVALLALAVVLLAGWYYAPAQTADPLGLAALLALLVSTLPLACNLRVAGLQSAWDHKAAVALDYLHVAVVVAIAYMAWKVVGTIFVPRKLVVKTLQHGKMDGKDYPHEFVGCGKCGKVLGLEYFFSCQTCTASKTGCQVSYELCDECVFKHDRQHEVLFWEFHRCMGLVDFEATKVANLAEEARPLMAPGSA